jgi:response regulator receiver domain-containing protein
VSSAGRVELVSESGAGTTVRCCIPVARSPSRAHGASLCRVQSRRTMSMWRVLLVDDSALIRNAMQAELEPYSLELVHAENGELAVERALSAHRDLIFLDMVMPVMDGPTALRRIRARGDTTPVGLPRPVDPRAGRSLHRTRPDPRSADRSDPHAGRCRCGDRGARGGQPRAARGRRGPGVPTMHAAVAGRLPGAVALRA